MSWAVTDPPATVSIVIPAYNHGRFVAEAIESVLAQDTDGIELIVIDDGSTDETAAVVAQYAARARVVTQPNAGQAATINRGWAESRGEVLSYLSADDRLEPGAVAQARAALAAHPAAVMVYGDYDLIDPHSRFVRRVTSPPFDYVAMVRDLECAPGPGVFVRRAAATRIAGWSPECRQAPDFEYWLRLALLGPFLRIPAVWASLRVHPGSASYAAMTPSRANEPVRIIETYFSRENVPASARSLQRRALSSAHLLAARAHLRSNRVLSAARCVLQAGRLSPTNLIRPRSGRLLVNALANRMGHQLLWQLRRVWRRRTSA